LARNIETVSDDSVANARLAAIVESSYDAIISKDLNSTIISWNPAAQSLFGYTSDEAIGRSVIMLIPDHLRQEEIDIISRIRAGEVVKSYETVRKRKDGKLIPVSLTVSPIRDARGTIVGASKIARDISASKESERRIRLLLREVNHRVKNQFAVIVAMVRETARRIEDPADIERQIRDRIMALARSHDLLVSTDWAGADLTDLIRGQLASFGQGETVKLDGPPVRLAANAVQNLGMAFHELGTNSAKHGVLSGADGTVLISWSVDHHAADGPRFQISWVEAKADDGEGAELANGNGRKGFGSVVLLRVAPQALGGESSIENEGSHYAWRLSAPLGAIMGQDDD
jgi:PAS domain S-box-containing protein